MSTEQDYWDYKANLDRTYGDLEHQSAMNALVMEEEYKLFSLLRPRLMIDGNQWCCLYGENLHDGIAGFGDTPYLAILSFNREFGAPIKPKV